MMAKTVKKEKGSRTCFIIGKFQSEDYKNCLQANQFKSKIIHL